MCRMISPEAIWICWARSGKVVAGDQVAVLAVFGNSAGLLGRAVSLYESGYDAGGS